MTGPSDSALRWTENRPRDAVTCHGCGKKTTILRGHFNRLRRQARHWHCSECINNDDQDIKAAMRAVQRRKMGACSQEARKQWAKSREKGMK